MVGSPVFPRRGLGAASVTGEKVGGAILASAGAAGPAAPVVAAVGALVELISSFVGGGCGQACILSAQAEQVYEVAMEDMWFVAQLGMLSQNDYLAACQALIQGGTQHMQALEQSDPKAADGLANFTKVTSGYATQGATLPATAPVPLDLTKAQTVFLSPATSGWYSQSITAGNQLALSYLQALASAQSSSLSISPSAGTVTVLGTTFSMGTALLVAAAVAAVWYFA